MTKSRHAFAAVLGFGALIALAGCATPTPMPVTPTPTPTPSHWSEEGPSIDQDASPLTAQQALFDKTNLQTSRSTSPDGAAFLSALVSAGFAADTLEVTTDLTSAGLTAPSIQFAARVGSTCLIGQFGPDATGYRSVTAPPITTGRCLIGSPSGH